MELLRVQGELIAAAEKLGIEVRVEALTGPAPSRRGGLCTVRGRKVLLVDAAAPLPDRIATIASTLARLDLDGASLTPVVRATIGTHDGRGAEPTAAARPLARARKRKTEG